MKNKSSKKKLKKMIASGFTDLSTEEIKALIQKEVEKGPDILDTDYIDLCFKFMSIKNNKSDIKKTKLTKPLTVEKGYQYRVTATHYAKKSLFSTQKVDSTTGYLTF